MHTILVLFMENRSTVPLEVLRGLYAELMPDRQFSCASITDSIYFEVVFDNPFTAKNMQVHYGAYHVRFLAFTTK